VLREDQFFLDEKINCIVDTLLGTETLIQGVPSETFISSNSPFEDMRVMIGGKEVTGHLEPTITRFWG